MSQKSIALPRRKIVAILLGFLAFQILLFPFDKSTLGNLLIPWPGTLGFFLCMAIANLINLIAFKKISDSQQSKYAKIASGISIIAALATLFRASIISQFLLSFLSIFWWGVSFYLSVLAVKNFGSLSEVLAFPLRLGIAFIPASTKALKLISKLSLEGSRAGRNFSKLFLGLIITIPVAGVLLILLSSADPVFGHLISQILTFDLSIPDLVAQIAWRLFFSIIFLLVLLLLVLVKIKKMFVSPLNSLDSRNSQLLGPYLMLAITFVVILTSFLLIQFKYLFSISNLADLTAIGIPTFSEYVRRGFVELILATGLVYLVSGVGLILYKSFRPSKVYLLVNSLLIILNLTLGITAYRRVSLYTIEHGLTHIRIYGVMVLLVIAVFLLTLFARYFLKNHKLYAIEVVIASVIVFVFGITNVDYLLTRVAPPTVNKQVDFNYLSRLSADDPDSWAKVYDQILQNSPTLLHKESLDLDERILLLRSWWAIDRIYGSIGRLAIKYDYQQNQHVFVDDYRFDSKLNWTEFNIREYSSFLTIKDRVNFIKLKDLRNSLSQRQSQFSSDIPPDVYQFY